jgi:hypothetical protein
LKAVRFGLRPIVSLIDDEHTIETNIPDVTGFTAQTAPRDCLIRGNDEAFCPSAGTLPQLRLLVR